MLDKYKPFIAALFLLIVCSIAYSAHYYAQKYKETKSELDKASTTISTMQSQQKTAAELDAKYTKDLADAQNTIDRLRDDVTAGNKRLSVRAKCVPQTTTGGSVGDAGTAELDEASRKDYYDLLRMMELERRQVLYLQEYIKNVLGNEE